MIRSFSDLTVIEILALAVKVEKNNVERLQALVDYYTDYDEELKKNFTRMKEEELQHLKLLKQKWCERYGDQPIPVIDEDHIKEVVEAIDVNHGKHLIFDDLTLDDAKSMVIEMEKGAYMFYLRAAGAVEDQDVKNLLSELASFEYQHMERVPALFSDQEN